MLADLVRQFRRAVDPLSLSQDIGITPDNWQADFLTSTARDVLMLCSRQAGKSTVAAIKAIDEALFHAPSLTILISPSQTQSQEIYRKANTFRQAVPDAPRALQENLTRLELENGSRIISLPGSEKTVRGYSGANLIIVDEASRVDDELITAIRPMLATTNGRFIALTTPKGKQGWFYKEWTEGEGWEHISIDAHQCPRISQEFLASELKRLGPMMFAQEYMCEFIDAETNAFQSEMISAAFTDQVKPLFAHAA